MKNLVLSSKFKRSFRKFVSRDKSLQKRIETLLQMRVDVFSPNLATHKLEGELKGLMACSCGYDCRIIFSLKKEQ